MSKVEIHTPAPDFELDDFKGQPYRLADRHGEKRVLLVFNRGFS